MRRIAFSLLMTAAACGCRGVSVGPPPFERQASALATPVYPLKVGPTGRYLVDQNDVPFLWTGDAGWSLIVQPTLADAEIYLHDRKSRGFNLTLVNLIEHQFSDHAPANHDGIAPFTGRPFATPDERYFQHVDDVINQAAARGINVLLDALYLGYQCGDQGWCREVAQATPDEMKAWGKFLGQRYTSYDNLIWVIGGDTDPSPVRANVLAFVNSLISYDSRHLVTTHQDEETTALSMWPNQSWLKINNVYSDTTTIYVECQDTYEVSPVIPYFLMETDYENEHGLNAQQMRAEIYWPVLSGAMGVNFGNCPIWNFGMAASPIHCGAADWKTNLGNVGSENMRYLHRLLASRPWHTLVPDLNHTALTAGYGGDASFAAVARASDGATLIAYLPDSRQVTVDMAQISGGNQGHATAFWYAPGNGAVTSIGTFATTGTQRFTPPSAGDWVLVVDDASRGYPVPGALPATSSPPTVARAATAASPGTGNTSNLDVLGADDGGEAALSYTWRASAAPAGASVTFAPNGSNAAKNSLATFSAAGSYTLTATIADVEGQTATSTVSLTVTSAPPPPPPSDTLVDFENLSSGTALTSYGGITWAAKSWKVGDSVTYTRNAFMSSTSRAATAATFALPAGKVLKSMRIAVGSGGRATVVLSSPGNATQTYAGINGTYATKVPGWSNAAQTVTVTVTCATSHGASDVVFDNIVYGDPSGGTANRAPTVAAIAAASPSPITGTTANLSVLGADDGGEANLTYTWVASAVPTGGTVTFSANGTNAAKNTTASFNEAGAYTLQAALRDAGNLTVTSNVSVTVQAQLASVTVSPASASVAVGGTQQLTASAKDQFGSAFTAGFTWSATGGGTISASGLFTAGNTAGGPFAATASALGKSGSAQVTVTSMTSPPPPSDTVVDFESLSDGAALASYGGITWNGGSWRIWDGGTTYTKNAFVNSLSKTATSATFTLPDGKVLKSMRIAVGSGGTATVVLSSPGNPTQTYTGLDGTYATKTTGWTTAAQTVTVTVTCATSDGASDAAFDTIVYGSP